MSSACNQPVDETPDFTIVTPSYNYGHFIRECIESVLAQEGVTYEHIIQDACSTDNTPEILDQYPHLKVFYEKDTGMSDAINRGFKRARGKWVMWLNTDDVLKPGSLKAVREFAELHPEADVVHGAWEFVDAERKHLRYMKAIPCKLGILIYNGCYLASTALFLKRETIIGQGLLLNEKFRYDMDGEYYVRLKKAGKVFRHYNKVLAEFRWHDANLSGRKFGQKDINSELLRQRQNAENRTITRTYGRYMTSCNTVNEITDALLFQYWRFCKGFLQATTSWVGGRPLI